MAHDDPEHAAELPAGSSAASSGSPSSATVSTSHGGYRSAQAFVSGLTPAMWVGVAVLAIGALVAAALPFATRAQTAEAASAEVQPELAAATALAA